MHDAIIVGGGPSGSHAARRLAENGCKVLVLEKQRQAGEKRCCTGIVGQECVSTFEIDNKVILRQLNSAILFSPTGNSLYLSRREPQAYVLDRSAFDVALAERAQRAGAEYSFSQRVTDISLESGHASVTVSHHGKESKIPARAVVIASGFTPGPNRRLGLGTPRDYVAGVQVETATPGLEETEVYFGEMAPGFFGWLVPTSPDRGRVGLMTRREPRLHLKKWLQQLVEQGKIATADVQPSYGGIPLKPPARTYGERMLAVGDAAGQVKPTSGGGIYFGLIGAEIAAGVLYRALADGDLSVKRLAGYEHAWRKKLGGELKTGYRARKLFERLNDRQIDQLFKIIKARGIDEALLQAADVSFDWHSRTIARLIKYQVVAKSLEIVRLPFKSSGIDQ
jgi:geranylgeranyl reductase family protein